MLKVLLIQKHNFYYDLKARNFIKKRLQHTCFPVKFAKFLRITFYIEHLPATTSVLSNLEHGTIKVKHLARNWSILHKHFWTYGKKSEIALYIDCCKKLGLHQKCLVNHEVSYWQNEVWAKQFPMPSRNNWRLIK